MQYIYILEDDSEYRDFLKKQIGNAVMIENLPYSIQLVTGDPQAIVADVDNFKDQPSLFFLDIEIENSKFSGVDLATFVRAHAKDADIIFVTNHPESALLIVTNKIMPLDLIQKGVSTDTCSAMIRQDLIDITHRRQRAGKDLTYTVASVMHTMGLDQISYLATVPDDPGTLEMVSENETAEFHGNLTDYEQKYPEMFRCHKSYLVNLERVASFDAKHRTLTFVDGNRAEVSFRKVASVRRLLAARG